MSDIVQTVKFPLDDDGFVRRECPLCKKELKVLLKQKELADLSHIDTDSFLIEPEETPEQKESAEKLKTEYYCPYCGQKSADDKWWTQEQAAYINVYLENIIAKQINVGLIDPLEKSFGKSKSGPISIEFKGRKLEQRESWISPEVNDMEIFELPCCDRKIKVVDDWQNTTYCFFCGFPYKA